jgi:hypothetical protein
MKSSSIEAEVKSISIPSIDLHDRVMEQVYGLEKKPQSSRFTPPKLVLGLSILFILLVGTGYTALHYINLFDQRGERTLSILNWNGDNQPSPKLTPEVREAALALIQPGEAVAIYNPANNSKRIVNTLEKPIEYLNYSEFLGKVGHFTELPSTIGTPFTYIKGIAHHELADHPDLNMLYERSLANGGSIEYEVLGVDSLIHGITIETAVSNVSYFASIYKGSRWNGVYTDLQDKDSARVIPFRQADAILMTDTHEMELLWKPNKNGPFYSIQTNSPSANSETMMMLLLDSLLPSQK